MSKEKIIIMTKSWLPWMLVIILIAVGIFFYNRFTNEISEREETYNRQVAGILSEKEREMQKFNKELNLAESKLLTQEDLIEQYKKDIKDKDEEFEKFKKKHNLQVKNYEIIIAELKQKIEGGTTTTVIVQGECKPDENGKVVIKYHYEEKHHRVILDDPDIFTDNNEKLEINQKFKVQGEILEQKDGSLQTKRVKVFEVIARQRPDGTIEYEEIAEANLIDAKFNYSNEPDVVKDRTWADEHLDYLSLVGTTSYGYNSGLKFGVGCEFLRLKKIGFGLMLAADIEFDKWEKSGLSIGITYRPHEKVNVGIAITAGTEFTKFLDSYYINGNLVFYIW